MNRLANAAKNPLSPTLLGWGDPSPVAGNFDNARLDPNALEARLNLPDEMKGDGWGRGCGKVSRDCQVVAGAGDDMNTTPAETSSNRPISRPRSKVVTSTIVRTPSL